MKKIILNVTMILFVLVLCVLPVKASYDEAWMESDPQLNNVTDEAGLISEDEWYELEVRASDISEAHEFGVYIITVDDYKEYTNGDMHDACGDLYKGYSLGLGEKKSGLLLLLSMDDRDYRIYTYGEYGEYVFNQYGREMMVEYFLDNLREDDWYGAFADYLTWSEKYLIAAEAGTPYGEDNIPMDSAERAIAILIYLGVILIVPLIVAGIVVLVLTAKMKSVAHATEARLYVQQMNLIRKEDNYSHTTTIRQKIETQSSGSSGSSSRSSGGGSSTGGKF